MPAPTPDHVLRLFVNIDHVATLRQARRGREPDPIAAARIAIDAGAHGITAHLREDRRHIIDADISPLRALPAPFNLEMACTAEMLGIAEQVRPDHVTLVPERREEITTEGGLYLARTQSAVQAACHRLRAAGIRTALFIDADPDSIARARDCGTDAVELHTGTYAHHPRAAEPIRALQRGAVAAAAAGLAVHAGHGLTLSNVGAVAAIPEIEELNIGHAIISTALFRGLPVVIRDFLTAMHAARLR